MALVRWRPMNELDDMSRLFDEMWRRSLRPTAGTTWYPAIDVKENENEYTIVAELPGMNKDDVKISVTDNIVTIRGEKKAEVEERSDNWHQVERTYGAFERSFTLGTSVDPNGVKARFENGVLTVALPKSQEARPREIRIEG
jgi:HSP20 family protein